MMHSLGYKSGQVSPFSGLSDSPTLHEPDAVFNFNLIHATNSVIVENIPGHVQQREIISLFQTLIGDIRTFQDVKDGSGFRLEITFFNHDLAMKALCMNGYSVSGVPLKVSAVTTTSTSVQSNKLDDRRNLYVLGLPFALTKSEFAALFSQCGTVSHCVILATVDNSSRRRGFIVMSTHEEAKNAMNRLTRTQIRGHTIDVSWAVVQRSQGFLDGGDRAIVLDSRTHMSDRLPEQTNSTDISDSSVGSYNSPLLMICSSPTTTLLVSNLPTLLFSQPQDLHPLFFPFGHIDSLEVAQVSRLGCMSVILQYSSIASAQEAKDSLNGQLYGSFRIETRYVRLSSLASSNTSRTPGTSGMLLERRMTDPLPCSSVDLRDYFNDGQIIPPVSRGCLSSRDSVTMSSSLGTFPHYDLLADHKSKPVGPTATYLTTPYGIHDFNDLNSFINYGRSAQQTCNQ